MNMSLPMRLLLAILLACPLAAQTPPLQSFRNRSGTFQLDLPATWRQLAPNEARQLAALPGAPRDLGYVEPRLFYAVGPVDEWLAGRFVGPWLWIVEQENEWHLGEDFENEVVPQLREMWQTKGAASAIRHELADVRREEVGTGKHRAIVASRTSTPADGAAPTKSLDVHAPAGGQQFSLSFTCSATDFARFEPEFRRWLATLTFARPARGEAKLADRLWTPLLTGLLVSAVLLVLYKHTRGRSSS